MAIEAAVTFFIIYPYQYDIKGGRRFVDSIDERILELIEENARISYQDLGDGRQCAFLHVAFFIHFTKSNRCSIIEQGDE